MAYTSYFSSNSTTKAQPNNSGGNTGAGGKGGYTSYFGTKVQQAPTADELKANRAKRAQIKAAQPAPVAPPPKASLLTKVTKVAKDVGNSAITGERTAATGIARTLPGGTADIKAQTKATEQANKDVNFLQQQKKAGKITPARANTLIQTRAKEANNAATETGKTVKALPSKGQLAAGFASTAADIATGGTFGGLGKVAKTGKLIKASEISKADKAAKTLLTTRKAKIAQEVGDTAVSLGTNATAGGLNAAAGGGTKSDVIKNAAAGAVLPEALHAGATTASKVGTRIADGLSSKSAKTLLTNTKTQKLIKTGQEATSKPIAAQVNQAHIEQGLVKGDLKQTPIKDLSLAADHNQKLDSAKVAQYKKQIKDGEPIEPIVTHNVNGQQVIVDGQHKLEAAKQLGYDHVPTVEKVTGAIPAPKAVEARPLDSIQTAIETAHNSGDTAAAKQLEAQLPDKGMNPDAPPLTPESRAELTAKMRAETVPERGTSKVAQSIQEKAVARGLKKDFGEAAGYDKITIADQAKKAVELTNNRPELEKVISGEKPLPSGLRATALIKAVEEHPELSKDHTLINRLSAAEHLTGESSRSAQELRLARERSEHSPVEAIRQLRQTRIKAIEKRTKGTVTKAVNNEIKAIQAAKPHLQVKTWNDFVESIKC